MSINTEYGKLTEDQNIEYAPAVIIDGNSAIFAPDAEQYHQHGWKTLHLEYPTDPAREGYHYEEDGFDENETNITKKWKEVEDPVIPKNYSVPDLFFWLKGYDTQHPDSQKGQAVVDFLNSQNMYTIAVTTWVVGEDNEYFGPTLQAVKDAVGFTDEEIAEALAYAETNMTPDEMM